MADCPKDASRFPTTLWSVVARAGNVRDPLAGDALARLCEVYWPPVYVYIRRRGFDVDRARDLTQEFFTRLIGQNFLVNVSPDRGRFRTFVLACIGHFLLNEHDRSRARKRGGGIAALPLDLQTADGHLQFEPSEDVTPEAIYERRWALTLIERALLRLRAESRHPLFDRLHAFLIGEADRGEYARLAAETGVSEGALKVAVHRLRNQFRDILRSEVAATVATSDQVDDEIRFLLRALSSAPPEDRQ